MLFLSVILILTRPIHFAQQTMMYVCTVITLSDQCHLSLPAATTVCIRYLPHFKVLAYGSQTSEHLSDFFLFLGPCIFKQCFRLPQRLVTFKAKRTPWWWLQAGAETCRSNKLIKKFMVHFVGLLFYIYQTCSMRIKVLLVKLKTLNPECTPQDHPQCKNYYYNSDPLMYPSHSDWLHRFRSGEQDYNLLLSRSLKTVSKWHTEMIPVWAAAMWQLAFLDPEDEGTTLLWNMSYYTPDRHSVTSWGTNTQQCHILRNYTPDTVPHPTRLATFC
jgi:hypothetical protein